MVKAKAKKKKLEKKPVLTQADLLMLQLGSSQERERQLKKEVELLRKQVLSYKRGELQTQIKEVEAEIVAKAKEIGELDRVNAREIAKFREVVAALRERLGVTENESWGYDPETGEVHITKKGE